METTPRESANKMLGQKDGFDAISYDAGKKVGSMASDIVHSTAEYVKSGREYVSENPMKGVAIAAAAGAVVGSLITLTMSMRNKR